MRTLAVISFSLTGCVLAERIREHFKSCGWQVKTAVKSVYLPDSLELPLPDWTRHSFAVRKWPNSWRAIRKPKNKMAKRI